MAITATQKNPLNTTRISTGRYITSSTAAAFNIDLGYAPRYICIENVTSGDKMEWYEGMADASAVKTVAAGTRTIITSLGLTPSNKGFTVGLDLDVNVINEQLSWITIG